MQLRYKDARVVVYDDFLLPRDQRQILTYLDTARFRRVLPEAWGRGFRLSAGEPLVGVQVLSEQTSPEAAGHAYPTETALDALIKQLLDCRPEMAELIGVRGEAWTYFTACPYVYPAESGLGWHTDGHCAGAYIYYAHEEWKPHWGGELLVAYADEDCPAYSVSSRGILRNETLEAALKQGLGYYFAAVPNRVIFLRSGTAHMVKPVERAAGDHLRLSISGFFMRPPIVC